MDPDIFRMISVALDNQKDTWMVQIRQNNYSWIQLIDEKMWQGTAAKTLKFDSIPFNFLVSPKGIILAKGIKPDSLVYTVAKTVKSFQYLSAP